MTQGTTSPNVIPMDAKTTAWRRRFVASLAIGTKLTIVEGLKAGRTAVYRGTDADNPWLLRVTIDGAPRVVRFDWVTVG